MKNLISIVIPAYNEEDRLLITLRKIFAFINENQNQFNTEVIVVSDGSTDRTEELVLQEFGGKLNFIILPQNMGKGAAVREGILNSKGDLILFTDADGSTPITELIKLKTKIEEGFDLVIGSRRDTNLVNKKQPFYRIVIGRLFNIIAKQLMGIELDDTQCGFKLVKGEIGRKLFAKMKINGFSFDVELLYLAVKQNLKIKEEPVIWVNDDRSKVNVFLDPIKMFFDLIKIRFIHFKA